jgi:Protein of unknown function (DUF3891)
VIVRLIDEDVHLITQPDHARLARTIMEHCVPLVSRARRDAILHAIAEHDNGWTEEDAAPTVDPATGDIVDFVNAPLSVRHAVWPRGISRLAADPWAAALVAQHAITVYDRFRSDANWTSFFARMEAMRDAMVRESGVPLDDLAADYAFVRLGDLISLTFCTGSTNEQGFGEWIVHPSGTRVVITPDPFPASEIPIHITATVLPARRFRSDAELREALSHARATTLHGVVGQTQSASGRDSTART